MPNFPGRLIKLGEADAATVTLIQNELTRRGYGPFEPGVFDRAMASVVSRFQAQHFDSGGHPLKIDGEVGLYTWGALFGDLVSPPILPGSNLLLQALAVAATQVGQMEDPVGMNRGPMVDAYLRSVGIDPTQGSADDRYWCMAFMYWVFAAAASSLGRTCPLPRTAGCVDHWNKAARRAGARRITKAEAYADPVQVQPGQIFILDFGGGHGHTGIVERLLPSGHLVTIEGNGDPQGGSNGIGVFRLSHRKLNDRSLKGFVDYSAA